MASKPEISNDVYYTKHNKIPLKLYFQEDSDHDAEHFIVFCLENREKKQLKPQVKPQLLISANDTLTLSSKKKGLKRLLVKVRDFESTPHNQNCLGYIYPSSVQQI